MKLSLKFDAKTIVPVLLKAKPYLIGLVLIGTFGYTAYVINSALNVAPAESTTATPRTVFDKSAIETVKNLDVVSGEVSSSDIGKDNPFSR